MNKLSVTMLVLAFWLAISSTLSAAYIYTITSKNLQEAIAAANILVAVNGKNIKMEYKD